MSLISDAARRHLRPEAYKTAEYQGWTNEETWSVALWFNNEYDHYQATRGMTSASELEAYARANYPADFTFAGQGGFDFDAVNWSELIEDIHTAKLASIKTAENPQSGHGETELDYPEVPDEHDPEPAWPWELEEEDDTPRYAEGVNVWAQNRVAFTAPASEKSGACADGDHSSCRMDHLVGERPVFAGEDLCLCPEHGTGAPRGFQPDPYYDLSGACDDGDHDACRMTHPDFGAYCLCNDVEHYGSGGGRKATRRVATPKTAASYRITVYERPDYTETFDDFFVPSHEDLVRVLATEYGIHTDSLSGRASSNEGTYVEWGQGFPDSGEDYYLGRKTATSRPKRGFFHDFGGVQAFVIEVEHGLGDSYSRSVEPAGKKFWQTAGAGWHGYDTYIGFLSGAYEAENYGLPKVEEQDRAVTYLIFIKSEDYDRLNLPELGFTASKTSGMPQSGEAESSLPDVEVGDEDDVPMWPWEIENTEDDPNYVQGGLNVWSQNRRQVVARRGWVDDFQGPYTSAYEAEGIGEGWIRPVEHSTPEPHEWKWDAFTYDTLPERGGGVAYSFEEAKQAVEDYVAANSVSGVQLSLGEFNSYKSAALTDEEVAGRDDSDLFL